MASGSILFIYLYFLFLVVKFFLDYFLVAAIRQVIFNLKKKKKPREMKDATHTQTHLVTAFIQTKIQ